MSTSHDASGVLIVDRHPLMRQSLVRLVEASGDLQVCGETGNAGQAIDLVSIKPQLVVMEIALNSSGLDLIPALLERSPESRILAYSSFDESVWGERVLNAGASGFVSKDEEPETVLHAMRQVLDGRIFFSAEVVRSRSHTAAGISKLTSRELEVFQLIGQGCASQQIATQLGVSVNTIESYRARIKKKLALKNGTELSHRAIQWVVGEM